MPNYRFVELQNNLDGSCAATAKAPGGRLVRLEAPPPPCLDPEGWAELCDGRIPVCKPYLPPSEVQTEQGVVACGCKNYEECANAWVELETLRAPARTNRNSKNTWQCARKREPVSLSSF